jgi:phosphoribosylamine--glycine ligase
VPKFFIWSKDGDSVFLASRLLREGHDVRVYIHNKESKDVGRGMVPLVATPAPRKGETVIFDAVGFGYASDMLRRRGFSVISSGAFGDRLEHDRGFAISVMRDAGIAVPDTREFSKVDEARRFLREQDPKEPYYIKPCGDEDCASTHGAKDIPDMLRWLDFLVSSKRLPKKFLLQKKMESVAELSFEGFFDGTKWVLPWNSTIEDKRFLVGNVGPNTGCMANLVWAYRSPMPMLALRTLTRLTTILRQHGYRGPIDINLMFDEEGVPYGLEFTARFGYMALQALTLLIGGDLGAQLWEFANGTLERFEAADDKFSLAVGVSVPPFPNSKFASEARGVPLDPKLLFDPIRILLSDVMIVGGKPYITGSDASVAAFCDTGTDVSELRSIILERIKQYAIPDAQYRTDPVERAERELEFLSSHNYEVPNMRVREYEPPIALEPAKFEEYLPEGPISEERPRNSNLSPSMSHFDSGKTFDPPTFGR